MLTFDCANFFFSSSRYHVNLKEGVCARCPWEVANIPFRVVLLTFSSTSPHTTTQKLKALALLLVVICKWSTPTTENATRHYITLSLRCGVATFGGGRVFLSVVDALF